ncbi:hypothetical protein REPUB_Repub04eG0090500 [Reevesia pubescens]
MGCVATAAHLECSKVLGVIPRALAIENTAGKTLRDKIMVSCIHEHINIMIANVDTFIALPDGFGTLEEIFQIVSLSHLNIHQKPIGILNVNDFYDSLFSFLDHAVEQRFILQATRQILVTATTPEQLLDQLQAFVPQRDPVMALLNWEKDSSSKKQKLNLTVLVNFCLYYGFSYCNFFKKKKLFSSFWLIFLFLFSYFRFNLHFSSKIFYTLPIFILTLGTMS